MAKPASALSEVNAEGPMTETNRVDAWLAAQSQEPNQNRSRSRNREPAALPPDGAGLRVERRNGVSVGVGVFLFAAIVGMSWRLLPAFSDRSLMAHALATLSCALLLALMGWVVVSAIVSVRLAHWANGFVANDTNIDPAAAQERERVRDSSLDMEFRPPFSLSRPMRDALAQAPHHSVGG